MIAHFQEFLDYRNICCYDCLISIVEMVKKFLLRLLSSATSLVMQRTYNVDLIMIDNDAMKLMRDGAACAP